MLPDLCPQNQKHNRLSIDIQGKKYPCLQIIDRNTDVRQHNQSKRVSVERV